MYIYLVCTSSGAHGFDMSVTYMPLQDVTRSCAVHRNRDMLVGDFGHWFRLSMAHLRLNPGRGRSMSVPCTVHKRPRGRGGVGLLDLEEGAWPDFKPNGNARSMTACPLSGRRTDLVSSSAMDHTLTISTVPAF